MGYTHKGCAGIVVDFAFDVKLLSLSTAFVASLPRWSCPLELSPRGA